MDLRPYDFYRFTYPFDEEISANFAFYFLNSNVDEDNTTIAMNKWIGRIRDKIIQWQTQWYGESQSLSSPPELFIRIKGRSTIVYDSRSGESDEYQIGDVGRKVLEHLTKPTRMGNLAASLGHIQGFDAAKEIAFLKERRLIFQENEHLLSLVLPKKLPQMTCSPKDYGLKGISQQ